MAQSLTSWSKRIAQIGFMRSFQVQIIELTTCRVFYELVYATLHIVIGLTKTLQSLFRYRGNFFPILDCLKSIILSVHHNWLVHVVVITFIRHIIVIRDLKSEVKCIGLVFTLVVPMPLKSHVNVVKDSLSFSSIYLFLLINCF